ncbi:polysaccharide pyruvyl transferase family protein [Nostoc sp. CHAB 5844]|nr:polysaccharide pyruvyl transferase family protein [Nostoc sp. CHAB 5844]
MIKVGVVNAWGANRGDEAMLSSLLCYLNSLNSDVKTTIYAHEWLDLDRHNNVEIKSWITPNDIFKRIPKYFRKLFLKSSLKWTELLRPITREIMNYDFVISSPAGPYFGSLYPNTELQCLLQLAFCKAKGIPFGILATSAGPFLEKRRNLIRKNIFDRGAFWTVRENISLKYLSALETKIEKYTGTDLVFAHPKRDLENFLTSGDLDEFEQLLNLLDRKSFIIVTLNKTPFIGTDGNVVDFDALSYIPKMGTLLRHVIDSTNCQLIIFPHFYGDSTEQQLIKNLIKFVDRSSAIRTLNPFYNSEAQMYLYSKAEFAISHRYHPTIFAAKAECPFMCIRHQFKVDGMLSMFENPGPMVNTLDSSDKWIAAFNEAWETRDSIKQQIQKHLPNVIECSQKHFDILGSYIRTISQK